jgi:hypothetical protein
MDLKYVSFLRPFSQRLDFHIWKLDLGWMVSSYKDVISKFIKVLNPLRVLPSTHYLMEIITFQELNKAHP